MFYELLSFLLLAVTSSFVEGYIRCGDLGDGTDCYGTGAYCCGLYNDECCWDAVYSFQWFWLMWFFVVVFIISCSICMCIRRRRRQHATQPRYVIVDGTQPTYGTMPPAYNYAPATSGPQYTQGLAVGTAMPPAAPPYQEKPPDYSTIAAN